MPLLLNGDNCWKTCLHIRPRTENSKGRSKAEEKPPVEEKQGIQTVPEKVECKHYFGYLSKRPSKDGLPEECIVCKK